MFSSSDDRSNGCALERLEARTLLSASPGTWAAVANQIPNANGAQIMLLLSDGTIMVQGGSNEASKLWYRIPPVVI